MATTQRVRPTSSQHLETRVVNLEQGHNRTQERIDELTKQVDDLCSSVNKLKTGGWPVTVNPFQDQATESRKFAATFEKEMDALSKDAKAMSVEAKGTGGKPSAGANGAKDSFAVSSTNSRLVTDGPVDGTARPQTMPILPTFPVPGSATSSSTAWKPYYLTTLTAFTSSDIPASKTMTTFHPEFLSDHLGGTDWSPGMRFIPGNDKTCMLKNRTYYLLDPTNEPYLPEQPGSHGAKLTAFFNGNPEDEHGELPEGSSSYEDVPMFVLQKGRYVYFGNYSQKRWSDRLSFDEMVAHVPIHVKESIAKDLTSRVRQDWVSEELKNHFFKKPGYDSRLYPAANDDASVATDVEVKQNEHMAKDIKKYVQELRDWDREASMKTAMIKPQFILDAFNAADADYPPALRLWWEYFECVNWRKDFYDLLVTLQSRDAARYLK